MNINISTNELNNYLEQWINISNSNLNKPIIPFIHGKAGIGKTEIIESLAKKYNKKLLILNLSHQEEGDLIGIPDKEIIDGKKITIWNAPEWIGKNMNNPNVILFLDEIDRAPKNILNSILTLLREYRIHTHFIPKEWKIIAAGNSGFNDDFYDVQQLDNALTTRFVHFYYELHTSEWLKWAKEHNINNIIIKYLELNPEHLLIENVEDFNFPYPNPRTWEILSNNLLFIKNDELIKYISIGTIGKDIGLIFYTFFKQHNKIKIYTIYDLKNKWREFKNENKETYLNTVLNLNNNINQILKSFDEKTIIQIISKLIAFLIYKKYYEIAFSLISTLENNNQNIIQKIYIIMENKYKEQFIELKNKLQNIKNK